MAKRRFPAIKSTTILGIRRDGKVALGGDGQVTFGETVVKGKAAKVRTLYDGAVLAGFAGAAADSFSLIERFEGKLEEHQGNLARACAELVREWRTDKYLRRLEALLAVMDAKNTYLLSGDGDMIQPDDDIVALGSGGPYALAAARAYLDGSNMGAKSIVERSLQIASDICIFTNSHITIEELAAAK
jgi:ATP-dependent HslUV protease subunit HslV